MQALHLALIHYPVVNKRGETICAAVTNLDLHDIARVARTYNAQRFYVVTPLADQKELVTRITRHWTEGAGAAYNPQRRRAMALIQVADSLAAVVDEIASRWQVKPYVVATSARANAKMTCYDALKQKLQAGHPCLIMLGTAWGLDTSVIAQTDGMLPPIRPQAEFNHLSVRAAAAIIMDRLFGDQDLG
jgi:hypothetical protein